jgi:hypothetical protein
MELRMPHPHVVVPVLRGLRLAVCGSAPPSPALAAQLPDLPGW